MRLLDQWLHYIDTEEVLPLFEPIKKEYSVPSLQNIDRAGFPQKVANVVWDNNMSSLRAMASIAEVQRTLRTLNHINQKTQLRVVCAELINLGISNAGSLNGVDISKALLTFLPAAPFLAELYLASDLWKMTAGSLPDQAEFQLKRLLKEIILSTNKMQTFVKRPFAMVLQELKQLSMQEVADLVELIALTVGQAEFALDLLLECLEPECSRLLLTTPRESQQFVNSLAGIALDHIDEASSGRTSAEYTLSLIKDGENEGLQVVKATVRIDAPGGQAKVGDHVRLKATSTAINAPWDRPPTMDALVISCEQGLIRFRCIHHLPSFVEDCAWKLRQCGSFVTSKAMFDAVTALYGAGAASCGIHRQLLGGHGGSSSIASKKGGGTAAFHTDLNESQNRALKVVTEQPLTLLWGPPGTGKTTTIVSILKRLLAVHSGRRFLVTAPTHNAVDNLLQRFIQQNGAKDTGHEPLRVSTDLRKVAPGLQKYTCDAMVGKDLSEGFAGRSQAQKRVRESKLIFTTCAGAGLGLLRSETLSIVIVDEASQITEPGTLIPLTKGCQRAVLVGDHVQLRATVQRHAVLTGFDVSLFERLYTMGEKEGVTKVMLEMQYRMHPDICTFSSAAFYESKLHTAPGLDQLRVPRSQFPWPRNSRKVFVPCDETEDIGRQSKSNHGQVQLCKQICDLLSSPPQSPPTSRDARAEKENEAEIAILTPYTRQREFLQKALPSYTVSSIDGFQGREADIVIFVTVRCNAHHDIGFLNDLRRLNVVMTRAKAGVIVIGHRDTLLQLRNDGADEESKRVWKELLRTCETMEVGKESSKGYQIA